MTSSMTCWSSVSKSICQVREQTGLLLWKTCILFSRQQISIWAQVVTPFLVCLYIFMVQQMINALLLKYVDFNPAPENINLIPKCWGVGCVTLGVGFTNGESEWTTHVLEHVSKHQGLELGKDIVTLGLFGYEETVRQLSVHPNSTQTLVVFCTGEIPVKNSMFSELLLCSGNGTHHMLLYSIVYNFTAATMPVFIKPDEKSPTDRAILPVKIAIDNGILDYRRSLEGLPPLLIEAEISDYPHLSNRFIAGYDTVTMQGPLYFFLPPMIIFIMVMSEMVREKEQHLRQVLNTLGISQVAFWLSWIITGFAFSLVISNFTVIAGNVLGFDFFTKTPYL